MKHTKEPWVAEKTLQGRDSSISNRRGKTIAIVYQNENIDGDDLANAKRIVACVNECAGITDEALEAGIIEDALYCLINHNRSVTQDEKGQYFYNGIRIWEEEE